MDDKNLIMKGLEQIFNGEHLLNIPEKTRIEWEIMELERLSEVAKETIDEPKELTKVLIRHEEQINSLKNKLSAL